MSTASYLTILYTSLIIVLNIYHSRGLLLLLLSQLLLSQLLLNHVII